MTITKEQFEANKFNYTKPIKFIKDLIKIKLIFFKIYDKKNNYSFYDNKIFLLYQDEYVISNYNIIFLIYNEKSLFKKNLKFIDFIIFKVVGRWINFVKKRKRQRIGLKLLKPISLHLGNPRFVNFNV